MVFDSQLRDSGPISREFWEHQAPCPMGFRCRILDNGLFILNLNGSCGSLIYLQRESNLLIQVSYHTQIAFDKHKRAPEPLP